MHFSREENAFILTHTFKKTGENMKRIKVIAIVSIVIVAIMISIGCTEDSEYVEEVDMYNQLIDDYNKRMDTYNQDINTLNSKMGEWESAYSMAIADEYLTSEEVDLLAGLTRGYKEESEYVLSHLNEFKDFITANEQELKNLDGEDPYSVKSSISDDIVTINQVVKTMESNIEEMIQIAEDTEDLEVLNELLDLFI